MRFNVNVWTKQHENILKDLEINGRYIVKKEYIVNKMEEHAALYLDVYNWYYQAAGKIVRPPEDVKYPIWVSLAEEDKIENSPGNVQLEILVEQDRLITMDIDKWGKIVNYMYIPADAQDKKEHETILARYGIDDCTAYMTPFYPNIKRMIIKSWDRLFDESIILSKVGWAPYGN
ncbi:DUF3841 domain-containing protein [Sporomusa acidovorans]|uniref:DUF3841 domain-containing protein n=1 Tax=Sporomusa acidovorans (strain ATCC 49682 / DSM 3132 / Mol) TaxID=1123286 RepID=A0ABZ3J1F3_SPOA4|nr:DUF3841 domain-containing protein [Sporomusa acidovorans]OZC16556.1 hypothetical protein SPACI_42380 [Sporomusa acidovorans DSM 3132]SDF60839.1 protein of unknown function [Sporomusa acidovorans]